MNGTSFPPAGKRNVFRSLTQSHGSLMPSQVTATEAALKFIERDMRALAQRRAR